MVNPPTAASAPGLPAMRARRGPTRRMTRTLSTLVASAIGLAGTGCASLLGETASTAAGVGGAAVANQVTDNAAVAAGIALGFLAAAQVGVKAVERNYHGDQQDRIAAVAGVLQVGQVGSWESRHAIQIEPDEAGKVTVSRLIGAAELSCKEIVFSVETRRDAETVSAFYVATICRDGNQWRWASAEPATARWGSLQ